MVTLRENRAFAPLPGHGARIYSNALIVKVKKIKLDKRKQP